MSARRAWTLAWLGGSLVGIANGAAREKLYAGRVGDHRARQLSTVSALALFTACFAALERRWPIPTGRDAAAIGARWLALTLAFEFGFGRYVERRRWGELMADYDLRAGRLWPLVLGWLTVGPSVVRALDR